MNLNDKYAIVDLEVSRPFKKGGEIIQFAVTFVKNWKIIGNFSTLVNPGHRIDEKITALTGIDNRAVKDQPYFEEIAPQIIQLLQDSIFVAHNAAFDWQFLNDSFQKIGFDKLNNQVIDTVQLSQVILPTSSSFKLINLASDLKIPLETNHHANDDADMTAKLLIELKKRIEKLPEIVLNDFRSLNFDLNFDNQEFISLFPGKAVDQNHQQLDDQIVICKPLVNKQQLSKKSELSYPNTENQKIQLFNNKIVLRKKQGVLMDSIYSALIDPTPNEFLIINSPKYLGKTLGYLMPSIIFSQNSRTKTIICTSGKNRRLHLAEEIDRKVDNLLNLNADFFNFGSLNNIIDTDFVLEMLSDNRTLDKNQNLFLARLLVWLIDTNAGNFDEFDNNLNKNLYQQFGVIDQNLPRTKNLFLKSNLDSLSQSNLIFIDHSQLNSLDDLTDISKSKHYNLIIDDADKIVQDINPNRFSHSIMPILIYQNLENQELKIARKDSFTPL